MVAVSVDHGENAPTGDANGPDGEVMLDIEVVGAIAPPANIAVYFAPNTDAGFLDAITTAIHDTTNKPSVISISWGGPESTWTAQAMTAMDEAFQAAATLGITVCVASGDNGSSDGVDDGGDHVDFPSSSPYALACGGTSLQASGSSISSETVWNDGASGGASGGGISSVLCAAQLAGGPEAPPTQGESVALNKRGVPDVAGDADPETGYDVRIDGTDTVIGGTSAVAPLWAGLIARINQVSGNPVRVHQSAALSEREGAARHHPGQQRRLRCRGGLGCVYRARQSERSFAQRRSLTVHPPMPICPVKLHQLITSCKAVSANVPAAAAAEQAEQSGDDQVDGDDVIQQPRHYQDQNAGDQRDEGGETEIHDA